MAVKLLCTLNTTADACDGSGVGVHAGMMLVMVGWFEGRTANRAAQAAAATVARGGCTGDGVDSDGGGVSVDECGVRP